MFNPLKPFYWEFYSRQHKQFLTKHLAVRQLLLMLAPTIITQNYEFTYNNRSRAAILRAF